jgi:DNA-binding NarL/FixJ family response regulator
MTPRILVADDHEAMLAHLVQSLAGDFEVVAAVGDGAAAVAEATRLAPDVVVLDISMPVMGGIAAAARLRAQGSAARFVFITMHHEREFRHEALAFGAVGFVFKERLASDLLPAIASVLEGRPFVSQIDR